MARTRASKKPPTICKQSDVPETKAERRERLALRRAAQLARVSKAVVVTSKQNAAERREAERHHRFLVTTTPPGTPVPPVSYPKNRIIVGKYIPAGPHRNVAEEQATYRRCLRKIDKWIDSLPDAEAA